MNIYIIWISSNLRLVFFITIAFFLINTQAYSQVDKKSVILSEQSSLLLFSEEYSEIEREYENDVYIIDESYSQALISSLEFFYRTSFYGVQVGGGLSFLKEGKVINKFEKSLSYLDSKQKSINLFGNPFIELVKNVGPENKDYKLYVKSKFTFPVTKKEHLFLDDRKIALLSYIFSFDNNPNVVINGEIFIRYFGKIKTKKKNLGVEYRDPFSEVGFSFYPEYTFNNFVLIPFVGFSLSTNYNTHNQYFSRLTDKGFSYYGGLELRYNLGRKYLVSVKYYCSSFVFNSIADDEGNDIDNEIEKKSVKFSFGVKF